MRLYATRIGPRSLSCHRPSAQRSLALPKNVVACTWRCLATATCGGDVVVILFQAARLSLKVPSAICESRGIVQKEHSPPADYRAFRIGGEVPLCALAVFDPVLRSAVPHLRLKLVSCRRHLERGRVEAHCSVWLVPSSKCKLRRSRTQPWATKTVSFSG